MKTYSYRLALDTGEFQPKGKNRKKRRKKYMIKSMAINEKKCPIYVWRLSVNAVEQRVRAESQTWNTRRKIKKNEQQQWWHEKKIGNKNRGKRNVLNISVCVCSVAWNKFGGFYARTIWFFLSVDIRIAYCPIKVKVRDTFVEYMCVYVCAWD